MSETTSELTIEQVIDILDIARPTAYKMAQVYGRKDSTITPRGKYFIPFEHVAGIVRRYQAELRRMDSRLELHSNHESISGGD